MFSNLSLVTISALKVKGWGSFGGIIRGVFLLKKVDIFAFKFGVFGGSDGCGLELKFGVFGGGGGCGLGLDLFDSSLIKIGSISIVSGPLFIFSLLLGDSAVNLL